jgi:hypothetical protein
MRSAPEDFETVRFKGLTIEKEGQFLSGNEQSK